MVMCFRFRSGLFSFCVAASLASCLVLGPPLLNSAHAETWSDATGKFKLEAEYAGIDGKSVVLRKPDGKSVKVPIANLSPESRAQAKALYQKSKTAAGGAKPTSVMPTAASQGSYTPKSRDLKFTPPAVPTISPMPAFPENATLQETLDFVRDQAMAGHLEVFWFALPNEMREKLDSSEMREGLRPALVENRQTMSDAVVVVDKLSEVLITKKRFILKSPILAQAPPQAMPLIQAGYDPVVGLIYEYSELAYNTDAVADHSITGFVSYHAPRIGAHVKELLTLVPAELRDPYLSSITATQSTDTTGTISWPKQDGTTDSQEMVLYDNRWIPKDLADEWQANKETIVEQAIANATGGQGLAQSNPQAKAMGESMIKQANAMLDPLIAAKTQQEFDFALGQVMMPLMMAFGGGAGPGTGGPFGAGPGAP